MRRVLAVLLLTTAPVLAGGGYFGLGYQSNGAVEFGGGGYYARGNLLVGGEGYGSPAGYGYGLGFVGLRVLAITRGGVRLAVVPRVALGGGGGRGWAGLMAEAGLSLPLEYSGLGGAVYLAYQFAGAHSGIIVRLYLGKPFR